MTDMLEPKAEAAFHKFVEDFPAYDSQTDNVKSVVKSFFLSGYLIGVRELVVETMKATKETVDERPGRVL